MIDQLDLEMAQMSESDHESYQRWLEESLADEMYEERMVQRMLGEEEWNGNS